MIPSGRERLFSPRTEPTIAAREVPSTESVKKLFEPYAAPCDLLIAIFGISRVEYLPVQINYSFHSIQGSSLRVGLELSSIDGLPLT